jgi:isopenicillin N synthase-like dioxygenase
MAPLLENGDVADLVAEIRMACEQVGFFYVKNHGIPAATITAVIDASQRFFEQPPETRMKTVKNEFGAESRLERQFRHWRRSSTGRP